MTPPADAGGTPDTGAAEMVPEAPLQLASVADQQVLTDIFVDGDGVYFTAGSTISVPPDATPGSDTRGVVRRVGTGGGPVQEIWSGQGIAYDVSGNASDIHFLTYDYNSRGRTGTMHRLAKSGGPDQTLATWTSHGSCQSIAVDGAVVYWTHSLGAGGAVKRMPSPDDATLELAFGEYNCPREVTAMQGLVFWLSRSHDIHRVPASGGPSMLVWTSPDEIQALVASPVTGALYAGTGDRVMKIDAAAGSATAIATGQAGTIDLATDDGFLYWASGSSGQILKMPIQGGSPVVLASGQQKPIAIAVDGQSVYWVDAAALTVMKVPKS